MDQAIFILLSSLFSIVRARLRAFTGARVMIALVAFSCAGAASAAKKEAAVYDFGGASGQYEDATESKGVSLWASKAKRMVVSAFTNTDGDQLATVGVIETENYSDKFKGAFEQSENRVFGLKLNYKF